MAIEQYYPDALALNDANKEDVDKWKSVSAAVTDKDNNPSGGFDCNICLDFVQDPVVTLCGHLYCWPCIYKWLHFQSISSEDSYQQQQQQQCPVCKAQVSSSTLVPLYGRGQTAKPSKGKALDLGLVIPRRPLGPICGFGTQLTSPTISPRPAQQLHHRNYLHQSQPYYPHLGGYTASPMLSLGGTTTTNVFHPIIGMFGEMFYARVFGNSVTNLYNYPNSYHLEISSPRVRRHVMQADKSLGRICFFLFCCIFFCLLLF